jgi:hypothetical protein
MLFLHSVGQQKDQYLTSSRISRGFLKPATQYDLAAAEMKTISWQSVGLVLL